MDAVARRLAAIERNRIRARENTARRRRDALVTIARLEATQAELEECRRALSRAQVELQALRDELASRRSSCAPSEESWEEVFRALTPEM